MENTREIAIKSLAIIGFVALLFVGIGGAIYSSRFIPGLVNSLGSAVYLSSTSSPQSTAEGDSTAVSTASSTISFDDNSDEIASSTNPTPTTTPPVVPRQQTREVLTRVPVAPHGNSDLSLTVQRIGYLDRDSTNSFVPSPYVPDGKRPAVKFTIKNIGTNWTGTWRFSAEIPTRRSYTFESEVQPSLAPGNSVDYVLGFDQATSGDDEQVVITVDGNKTTDDANRSNNSATIHLRID